MKCGCLCCVDFSFRGMLLRCRCCYRFCRHRPCHQPLSEQQQQQRVVVTNTCHRTSPLRANNCDSKKKKKKKKLLQTVRDLRAFVVMLFTGYCDYVIILKIILISILMKITKTKKINNKIINIIYIVYAICVGTKKYL